MADTLSIVLNTAQQRLEHERVTITIAGDEWVTSNRTNVWTEPVSNTTLMLPFCLDSTWQTSNTGDCARLTLTDFALSSPTWQIKGNTNAGQVRMWAPSGMGASSAISSTSFGVNRGFYVSFHPFNTGNDNTAYAFECGWSDSGGGATGVSLRLFAAAGDTQVYKDGDLVGTYSFGAAVVNKPLDFIFLPMRRRELLVFCITTNQGFVHVFDDISEIETAPVITVDESFWFFVPGDLPVDCELAPLRFHASGSLRSKTFSFGKVPQTGQGLGTYVNSSPAAGVVNARVFADPGSWIATDEEITAVNLLEVGGGAYTPDGVVDQVVVEVQMNADTGKGYTPFLRAISTSFQATFVSTDDTEEFDITDYVSSASLNVPDDPGGVELSFSLFDPQDLQDNHVAGLLEQENIPCQVKIGDLVIIDGVLDPLRFEDATNAATRIGGGIIRDRIAVMKNYALRDRIPLDGLLLSDSSAPDCVGGFFETVGITAYDIDDIAYVIPSIPGASSNDFSHMVEGGSTPFDEITALVTEIAFGFYWGIRPTATGPRGYFHDPTTWTGASIKVYRHPDDAVADGVDPEEADARCYEGYHEEPLTIAGNELRVTGFDPRKKLPIIRWKEDPASKDATIAPSSRPANWVGEPRVVGFQSPRLQTSLACENLVNSAWPKISDRNFVGGAETEMLFVDGVPIWRGDEIDFDGKRSLRVSAFTAEFISEQDDLVCRSASYTGGASLGLGGNTASQIKDNFKQYWDQRTIRRQVNDALGTGLPSLVAVVT